MVNITEHRHQFGYLLPVTLLIAALALYASRDDWIVELIASFPDQIRAIFWLNRTLALSIWITATWSLLSLIRVFVFEGLLERRRGRQVPALLTNLFRSAVVATAAIFIAALVFDVQELTLALLMAGLVAFVALFLRDPLTELFAGLSLNLDQSIDMGSSIGLAEGPSGRVTAMNWRSVTLSLEDGSRLIVPNSLLAGQVVRDLASQATIIPIQLSLTLDFSLPVERGTRILNAALLMGSREPGIVDNPGPAAFAHGPGTFGIEYQLNFACDTRLTTEGEARSLMTRLVMQHLNQTGLGIALPKQNVFVGEVRMMSKSWDSSLDREALITKVDLFSTLEAEEIRSLAESIVIHQFTKGAAILKQGDATTSMYGLAEGLLEVSVTNDGRKVPVAVMEPGSFFGEMSMLAGEPRSATVTALSDSVVFEITRESFSNILQARSGIAQQISHLMAARLVANDQKIHASRQEQASELDTTRSNVLNRIRSVFSFLGAEASANQ